MSMMINDNNKIGHKAPISTKIFQLIKMSWMIHWRMMLAFIVFGIDRYFMAFWLPIIISSIIVFALGRTIGTWPLIRLKDKVIFQLGEHIPGILSVDKKFEQQKSGNAPYNNQAQPQIIKSSTNLGRMTGFEPKILDNVQIYNNPLMIGKPGEGLKSANFSQKSISIGMEGEINFAKALTQTQMIDKFKTIWSVPMPDKDYLKPSLSYNTDIDCILATADTIYLIDLKNYTGGDIIYTCQGTQLFPIDKATGNIVGGVKTMTRNMEMATEIMKGHFPHQRIIPIVIFMPTNRGESVLNQVFWPGGIQAINLTDFLDHLAQSPQYTDGFQQQGIPASPTAQTVNSMSTLKNWP